MAKCPHCGGDINIRESNQFGYAVGSKGAFISEIVANGKSITLREIMSKVDAQYPKDQNYSRAAQVLYQMKKDGFIIQEGNIYRGVPRKEAV